MKENKDRELHTKNKVVLKSLFLLLSYMCHNYQQPLCLQNWYRLGWFYATESSSLEMYQQQITLVQPPALPPHMFSSSCDQNKKINITEFRFAWDSSISNNSDPK